MKNIILKTITAIAVIVFMIGCLLVELHPIIALSMCMISGLWILLFQEANPQLNDKYYK